ncbi:MAG TPA: glycoside hydrolase family 2 protein [Halanaerobiales bacterium]|nr:glycoside hydrolase family 2 protein [Halanaerobiales bacterium]
MERNLLLWLELEYGGETVSSDLVLMARPKHMEFQEPQISKVVTPLSNNRCEISLQTAYPALWVYLSGDEDDICFSDNFFHLSPGKKYKVEAEFEGEMDLSKMEKGLFVCSLYDTYSDS